MHLVSYYRRVGGMPEWGRAAAPRTHLLLFSCFFRESVGLMGLQKWLLNLAVSLEAVASLGPERKLI